MHHTAVGAGVRAHHAASPRVAGGCNNSHRGAAAAHLSPQNAAPNSARRGRSTSAHRMYTSGAPPPAPGICSTHAISSSVSRSRRGPMHGVQMGEGDAHPFACAPARIRLQGGQVAFFGAGRGRVVSPPRGVVPDRPPVPSVGGRSALPHVDLPLPASLSSSSVSWGRRCGSSGQKITRKTVNLLMISTCENPAQTLGTLTYRQAALQPEGTLPFLSAKQAPSSGFPIRFCSATPSLTMVRPYTEHHPRWTNCRRHLDAHPEPEFW
jgi:hypothetical protein